MKLKKLFAIVISSMVTIWSSAFAAMGESGSVDVISTLQDPVNYGGCMIRISPGPADISAYGGGGNLDCPGDVFVSFDCLNSSGQTTKSSAQQMFSTAQLAYVSGAKVNVIVDDAVKLNGFCLARRIDLQPPP